MADAVEPDYEIEMLNSNGKLNPVVGYQGGKRRLLPRLRHLFPVDEVKYYIEPFVGMGALYLDLRARGFSGMAVLADSNPEVAAFWRYVHVGGEALLCEAIALGSWPTTTDGFREMLEEPVPEGPARVARFLWLTNYTFGCAPARYLGAEGWSRAAGTKLTSAARWGKSFPWGPCVRRLGAIVVALDHLPAMVLSSAEMAVRFASDDSHMYADPPYIGRTHGRHYGVGAGTYAEVRSARGFVVLSESGDVDLGEGWEVEEGTVLDRFTEGRRAEARASRVERLYVRGAKRLANTPSEIESVKR